jgi:hypothetical protein
MGDYDNRSNEKGKEFANLNDNSNILISQLVEKLSDEERTTSER